VDGDFVRARGTTLGSDNGIGVAAALAVAEDPEAVHGPLELLFTIDEETGMTGAMGLASDLLEGRMMLNLDTEEENAIYIGCAGGNDLLIERKLTFGAPPKNAVAARVSIAGLRGGHSGVDIHEQRGNAIRILARVLDEASRKIRFSLADIRGGSKRNAIPREASAVVLASASALKRLRKSLERQQATLLDEIGRIDPDLRIVVEETSFAAEGKALNAGWRKKVLDLLLGLPNGVESMSYAVPGLVETSTNLATAQIRDEVLHVGMLSRSSVQSSLEALNARIHAIVRLAGGSSEEGGGYPGWKPDPDSALLKSAVKVHEAVLGVRPEYKAIHAGLECGVIGEKFPGMQMISFGPRIEGAHSPDERVRISTVEPFYRYLRALLGELG
jgi:dipeptidase D